LDDYSNFYAGLNFSSRNLLDSAAGGTFMSLTLGAVIDVGKGNIRFISPPYNSHVFPRVKSKGKKGRRKAPADPSTSSLDIT
jgi:hypothetical protein